MAELTLGAFCVLMIGAAIGMQIERREKAFWKSRADYWFENYQVLLDEIAPAKGSSPSAVSVSETENTK